MADLVTMPKLGLTMETGVISAWKVSEGQEIRAGQVLAEISTEKITYDLETESEGILLKILVPEDKEAPVGAPIAVVGRPGEDISSLVVDRSAEERATTVAVASGSIKEEVPAAGPGAEQARRVAVSPAAKKLAGELGVDLARVVGTGPGGRIRLEDVSAAATQPAVAKAPAAGPAANPAAELDLRGGAAQEIPYAGMRRLVGESMAASQKVSPTVTHHVVADVQDLTQILAAANMGRAEDDRVTITSAVVKAVALALERMPRVNASLEGDVIRVWNNINVGVAVALREGLIVPVVKDANRKRLSEIAREIRDFAGRARENRLLPDEIVGGTFTVTSLGPYRSVDWFSPIINQPEAAILGVGRVKNDVVAVDGVPIVRSTMGLSLTFDHRIIDGAPAAEFLRVVLDCLAEPLSILV